jgi:hypothetical protein
LSPPFTFESLALLSLDEIGLRVTSIYFYNLNE